MRGSKYELKYDYAGKPINEEEIRKVLKKDKEEKMSLWSVSLGWSLNANNFVQLW